MHLEQDVLHIFTDGSCWPNPGPGGWGAILIWNDKVKLVHGGSLSETNNTMELRAILEGLRAREDPSIPTLLYSDSQYCVNALTKWWKTWEKKGWVTSQGSKVKNQEDIREILKISDNVTFKWVKGHSGNVYNEAADSLATLGRLSVDGSGPAGLELGDIKELVLPYLPGASENGGTPFSGDPARRTTVSKCLPTGPNNELRTMLAGMFFVLNYDPEADPVELVSRGYKASNLFILIAKEQGNL